MIDDLEARGLNDLNQQKLKMKGRLVKHINTPHNPQNTLHKCGLKDKKEVTLVIYCPIKSHLVMALMSIIMRVCPKNEFKAGVTLYNTSKVSKVLNRNDVSHYQHIINIYTIIIYDKSYLYHYF